MLRLCHAERRGASSAGSGLPLPLCNCLVVEVEARLGLASLGGACMELIPLLLWRS